MATAIIQFRIRPSGGSYGSVQTGSAVLDPEDEVQLQAASYSGWRAARWEIQDFPPDYACPSGWSTDGSSGVYYYNSSPITGTAPPPFTMPDSADITAGMWGKWLCRVVVTTATGTITSDPRVGLKIKSPTLELNGIAFTEEDEFNAQRAYPGELQEDLVAIDGAATGGSSGPLMHSWYKATGGTTFTETAIWYVSTPITITKAYLACDSPADAPSNTDHSRIRLTLYSGSEDSPQVICEQITREDSGYAEMSPSAAFWESGTNPIDLGNSLTETNLSTPFPVESGTVTFEVLVPVDGGSGGVIPKGTLTIEYTLGVA